MDDVAAPPGVEVRRIASTDVDAVVAIERGAFTRPWSRETFLSLIDRPGVEILVLEKSHEGIVGYAVLWCIIDQGELANMAVTPEHRCQGLGSFLLCSVLDVARERKVQTVFLEVRASNEAALRMYERFGFCDAGLRPGYYENPKEDARVMKVTLG